MTAINGLLSTLTWAGYTGLYTAGFIAPYRWNLNLAGGIIPTTAMSASGVIVNSNLAAPYGWSGSISARMPTTPNSAYKAALSWGSGNYSTNVREWALEVTWGVKDITALSGSGVTSRSFIPLIASWRGSFTGYIDDTTALALPTVPGGTIQTLTLVAVESGATDEQFSGTANVTQLDGVVSVDGDGDYTYNFEGTGQLTVPGAATFFGINSNGIFDDTAGTLLTPASGSLVLTATTSRTFTGNAFASGFSVRAVVGGALDATVNFQGTGALTVA